MRLLPRSLVGRVFALYTIALFIIVTMGLGLFLWAQLASRIPEANRDGHALLEVAAPGMTEAAVVGDYDSLRRQMKSLVEHTLVDAVEFNDLSGGHLREIRPGARHWAPTWLVQWVQVHLDRPVRQLGAGGRNYGEFRLALAAASIAGVVWQQAVGAALLAVAGVAGGMVLIRAPLVRWLGPLERIGHLDDNLLGGQALAHAAIKADSPIEFRRTFEVLDRAASHLQAQREQAAATLEAIEDAVMACHNDGRVVLANEAALRLLQCSLDDLIGRPLSELLAPLADGAVSQNTSLETWRQRQVEWTRPDGRQRVLEANRTTIVGADGQAVGWVLACRDVTEAAHRDATLRELNATRDAALASLRTVLESHVERVEFELPPDLNDIEAVSRLVSALVLKLHEHSEQLDAIFALSPDGFVSFNGQHEVSYCSPGFTHLTGLTRDEVLGRGEADLFSRLREHGEPGDRQIDLTRLRQITAAGERMTTGLNRPQRRVLSLALHTGQAHVISQVLHLRDITRETEVDRMKSEFIATAAHELRTPMVGIFGYSELLVTRELAPERAKSLNARIHQQCKVMVSMLNEMLDLARLESRQGGDFKLERCDVNQIVASALTEYAAPTDRLPPHLDPIDTQAQADVDPGQIQHVLRNLLSNAYKYSPVGSPVEVRVVEDAARQRIGVEVEDHGIGMTPEQLQRVGERFYRADPSGAVLGTGLGMCLAREIASLHGGEIALRSAPGAGTVATLWLPACAETKRPSSLVPTLA